MGTVHLVGAGPGDPELLTVRAARLLAAADVVVHDALADTEALSLVPSRVERIDVGEASRTPGAARAHQRSARPAARSVIGAWCG